MTYRVEVTLDKPKSGMWHCGPNAAWVTVTHMQTMIQARAYHRHQRTAREMAMACCEMMVAECGEDICLHPEVLD